MKYLTSLLSQIELSDLSLVYLKNKQQKEIDFWSEFWQKEKTILMPPPVLEKKYKDKIMSFNAFRALVDNVQISQYREDIILRMLSIVTKSNIKNNNPNCYIQYIHAYPELKESEERAPYIPYTMKINFYDNFYSDRVDCFQFYHF